MKISKLFFVCVMVMGLLVSANTLAEQTATSAGASSKCTLSYEQIKTAADNGDADAQYALGYMYYYGKGGAPKDPAIAKMWIEKSANQKQPQAVKALALINAHPGQNQPKEMTPTATGVAASTFSDQETDKQKPVTEKGPQHSIVSVNHPPEAQNEKMTLVDMRHEKSRQARFSVAQNEPILSRKASGELSSETAAIAENGQYTLQLLGASKREPIVKLVKDHHLAKANIYRTTFKNKDWYVLVYGQYKTKEQARIASKHLEEKLAVKPWIKPYARMKQAKLATAS